ncbi:GGDEF domain-containing protein [Alkaliphilus peptidifermentans]|uniref:Diguanylate cyclase (GGDEF) domain-containing protein n=1 Tax=Alkaliphilus peptidifermentans DSM 18978 TaxID=1120976 RepID=A0A1G5JT17_9FIRM|nr:GGDEF domain-containing protein [Alkaliphilus peptidifermentans]SCY91477.1 diguanylate cyclase (GGDEF) domain-containing protein [Alkaliphilus peptidifermentans DSM 18978]
MISSIYNQELLRLLDKKEKEIIHLKQKLNNIEKHADMDDLMEIFNKRKGINQLEIEMSKAVISMQPLTLCFIDVDDLKKINDTLGHCQGDNILIAISNLIKKNVRKSDTVFRYGGDEIVIILPNTNLEEADNICRRIDNCLMNLNIHNIPFKISLSKGLVEFDLNKNKSPREFIKEADVIMYNEKEKKKAI